MKTRIRNFFVKLLVKALPLYQRIQVSRLRRKEKINVVFFAISLPQWRYQGLFDLMSRHPKFNARIVICPSCTISEVQQKKDIKTLSEYFDGRGIEYIIGWKDDGEIVDVRNELSPDILFYPQPYHGYYPDLLAYGNFWDKLLCYCPYAFWMCKDDWSYNLRFHNIAWKMFYPTSLHLEDALMFSSAKGRNMEIVGYPTADDFLNGRHEYAWKKDSDTRKRIIWAPHFSICSGGYVTLSNFLWMAKPMLELAERYSDRLQFVFKPHPRLYSALCLHPEWGESKAAEYYRRWDEMENTQVETGEFVDLFMTSDAMIHDCGSFAVEYHYTGKPVMYMSSRFEALAEEKNEIGKMSMLLHYPGKDWQDIEAFIENVVLNGEDPMKEQRQKFFEEYLLPPNGRTVAENMMDVFIKTFC